MTTTATRKKTGIPLALSDKLISQSEVCEQLDITRFQCRGLVKRRELKEGPKIGKVQTFFRQSFDAYLTRLKRQVR
jgi:hypothetical protein